MTEVITNGRVALYTLVAGLVLDRSALIGQTVAELETTLGIIRRHPKAVVTVVENAKTFFTAANMLDLIKANNIGYKLIAEKAKVTLRDEDVTAIIAAEAAKKAIEAIMVPPIPPYPFATSPTGWSIATDLTIGKVAVRRRRVNSTGEGTTYQLSLNQLRRIWIIASARWLRETGLRHLSGVSADGYTRSATVHDNRVEVGCQTIQRYELEQLALHLAWAFPEPK